ncbi:acyl-CoA synthetase [Dyella sp. A6]|uniref:3-hydroxyacyl-ACP dehydratase FabZ family protein n=1 Tax=Dyella aluminiiresistens TaxID=3069105 RepID=UPI002E7A59E4|nr:acyl-CoA synthetase [Dyella sp. A6]
MNPPREAELLDDRQDAGVHTLRLRIPPTLAHFDGHFPQAPVLPGVLQVQWALALAAPRFGIASRCRAMEALKFQRLIRPGEVVELELRMDPARGKLHFVYRVDGTHCSSGRLLVESTE